MQKLTCSSRFRYDFRSIWLETETSCVCLCFWLSARSTEFRAGDSKSSDFELENIADVQLLTSFLLSFDLTRFARANFVFLNAISKATPDKKKQENIT